jgi:hypothetical protein
MYPESLVNISRQGAHRVVEHEEHKNVNSVLEGIDRDQMPCTVSLLSEKPRRCLRVQISKALEQCEKKIQAHRATSRVVHHNQQ